MSGQLKEVRERISSVNNTQQITKAMKMVSAAKLKKAQDGIVQMRPYSERLDAMLKNILSNLDGSADTSLGQEREVKRALVVVITSNKGLCGAFNTNIIKAAKATIDKKYSDVLNSGNLSVLCIGKKGNEFFRKGYDNINLISDHMNLFSNLEFDNVAEIGQFIISNFENGEFDAVDICYGRFKNAGMQFAESEIFLPVPKIESKGVSSNSRKDYIFEPGKKELLDELIPTILKTTLHRYALDTHASEHGARMTAMDKATENAQEMLTDLKISYNKARQEAITKELSEIVGGAAALQG
tara:strand:+ start:594 stop:1487 length:894 start_codon:yes stop_codon:yes gene_type:complete